MNLSNAISVLAVVAGYIAFFFGTVGLANASRHRVEDLMIAMPTAGPATDAVKRAIAQNTRDYDNWYAAFLAINMMALGIVIAAGYCAYRGWFSITEKRVADMVLLAIACFAIACFHWFGYSTYVRECRDVLIRKPKFGIVPWPSP